MRDIKPKVGNNPPQKGQLAKDELGVDIKNAKLYIGLSNGNPLLISGGGGEEKTWDNTQPTSAEDVDGIPAGTVVPTGLDAISILERMLYPEYGVSFASINTGLSSSYELGTNLQNSNATISWTRSSGNNDKWITNSLDITYSGITSGSLLNNSNPLLNTANVNYPSSFTATTLSNNELIIKLEAEELVNGITSPVSISSSTKWWSRIFWGKSTNSDLTDPTSLSNTLLTNKSTSEQVMNMTANSGSGYFYVFIDNRYQITKMQSAGFDVALVSPALSNVNLIRNGVTIAYKRYRSSNELNAALNIITSYKFL